MVLTKAIGKLIMTDQSHQIPSQLQMGKEYGMQLIDQALLAAINAKEVDPEQAYAYASDKRQFQRFVTDMTGAPPARAACHALTRHARHRSLFDPDPRARRLGPAFSRGRSCRACASTAS